MVVGVFVGDGGSVGGGSVTGGGSVVGGSVTVTIGVGVSAGESVGVGVIVMPSNWEAVAFPGSATIATARMRAATNRMGRYFVDMVLPPENQF
jgi:hypothetical protein